MVNDMVRLTWPCQFPAYSSRIDSVKVSHLILCPLCCPQLDLVEAVNPCNVFDTRQSVGLATSARTTWDETTFEGAAHLFKQGLQRGETGGQKADGDFGRRPEGWRGIGVGTAFWRMEEDWTMLVFALSSGYHQLLSKRRTQC